MRRPDERAEDRIKRRKEQRIKRLRYPKEELSERHIEIMRALGAFDDTPWVPPPADEDIFGE